MSTNDFNASSQPPFSLKLEFSKAADYNRINTVFDPVIKKSFDPSDYVFKRHENAFVRAVNGGNAAFLADTNTGTIEALTLAYHFHETDAAGQDQHLYTELGTTLSRLPGYHSARLVVSAIALKEWLQDPPQRAMAADIKHTNTPSLKTYRDALGWKAMTDRAEIRRISNGSDKTLANTADRNTDIDAWMQHSAWYSSGGQGMTNAARILLSFMDQGGLLNKKTGDFIPVDFSALDDVGLTRPYLQSLAQGQAALPPPGPC